MRAMNRLLSLSLGLTFWMIGDPFVRGENRPATFAGEWDTTYGRLTLKLDAEKATGRYQYAGGPVNELTGSVAGNALTFTYSEPGVTGEGSFTLAEGGQSFTGRWREQGATQWQSWGGKRAAAAVAPFSGVWKTSYAMMRRIQTGEKVRGGYTYGQRWEIEGTVAGSVLTFTYTEPTGVTGGGKFTLAGGGSTFSGDWRTADGKEGGSWTGQRLEPAAGRTWLVVLEAPWEANLRQTEYSYGDMLRQFFTRVPSVAVRHRFFDGRDDFARWCAELAYLDEPVVLYISSHGSEQGITVGGNTLDGKFIGEQLRFSPNIALVHLGACLTMAGPTPDTIRKVSGLTFPVSGFTRVADWAGSAVIDFSYLDLVLSRQMKPGDAARQIQKSIRFAGEKDDSDSASRPAGLKIVE